MSDLFGNHIVGFPTRWLICSCSLYTATDKENYDNGEVANITKTCPCNIQKKIGSKKRNFDWKNRDIFLIFAQNIDCGYSLEPPRQGGSNEYPQPMFWNKNEKNRYTPAYPSFTI